MSDSTTEHVHDWKPISGWTGRYRCEGCLALGYRALVSASPTAYGRRTSEIVPYTCSKCPKPAVVRDVKRKKQFCEDHKS